MLALRANGAVPDQAGPAGGQGHEQLRVEACHQRLEPLLLTRGALDAREPGLHSNGPLRASIDSSRME